MNKNIDLLMCASVSAQAGGMYILTQGVAMTLREHGIKVETMFNSPFEDRIKPCFLMRYISPYLITAKIIFKLLSGYKIKVVEIHEPSAFFYCILKKIFKFLPFCYVRSHGVEELVFEICSKYINFSFKTKMLQRLRNFLNFIAFRYSNLNIFINPKDKYFVEQRYKVYHNILTGFSISPDLFGKVKKEEHAGINIAFIGSWLEIKGARAMEEIIPKVLSRSNNINFYLLGIGIKNRKIDEKFSRYKDMIIMVPQYNHSELPHYLNRCDILICPSIYDSGSLAILEGLCFKLAVICSENCSIYTMRELLLKQEAIISVAPDDINGYVDNILDLARDEAKRTTLANKGYEILREFTLDKILESYIKKFKKHEYQTNSS